MRVAIVERDLSKLGGRQITMIDGFGDCFKELGFDVALYSERMPNLSKLLTKRIKSDDVRLYRNLGEIADELNEYDFTLLSHPSLSGIGKWVKKPIACWYIAQPRKWYPGLVDRVWTNSYTQKRRLGLFDAEVIYPPHDYSPFREASLPWRERPIDILIVTPIVKWGERRRSLVRELRGISYFSLEYGLKTVFVLRASNVSDILASRDLPHEKFYNISRRYVSYLMGGSKILFHPSPVESFSLVIVEALNAGCYPIVRRAGAAEEQLGNIGFIYDDFREAEKEILRVLNDGHYSWISEDRGLKFDRSSVVDRIRKEIRRLTE